MAEKIERCQYSHSDMIQATLPDTRLALPLRRRWWRLKTLVWHMSVQGRRKTLSKWFATKRLGRVILRNSGLSQADTGRDDPLSLQPGDWVEVCSAKEIFSTLDEQGKNRGLRFTREMQKFCGRRFRVYKRLDKIILEATGELRGIRVPTVLLEDVICDGEFHNGCAKSCFCFWREAWLRRVPSDPKEK